MSRTCRDIVTQAHSYGVARCDYAKIRSLIQRMHVMCTTVIGMSETEARQHIVTTGANQIIDSLIRTAPTGARRRRQTTAVVTSILSDAV